MVARRRAEAGRKMVGKSQRELPDLGLLMETRPRAPTVRRPKWHEVMSGMRRIRCERGEPEFGARLDSFSEMRWKLEASVLPLATSVDGRRFSLQASLDGLQFQAGSYVVLDGGGVARLGRVLTLELDRELSTELTLSARAGQGRGKGKETLWLI